MQPRIDAHPLARRALVFDINRAGRIVADQHRRQRRLMPAVLQKIGYLLRQLDFDLSSDRLAVKNFRGQTNVPR
jgi:hypothetical protein